MAFVEPERCSDNAKNQHRTAHDNDMSPLIRSTAAGQRHLQDGYGHDAGAAHGEHGAGAGQLGVGHGLGPAGDGDYRLEPRGHKTKLASSVNNHRNVAGPGSQIRRRRNKDGPVNLSPVHEDFKGSGGEDADLFFSPEAKEPEGQAKKPLFQAQAKLPNGQDFFQNEQNAQQLFQAQAKLPNGQVFSDLRQNAEQVFQAQAKEPNGHNFFQAQQNARQVFQPQTGGLNGRFHSRAQAGLDPMGFRAQQGQAKRPNPARKEPEPVELSGHPKKVDSSWSLFGAFKNYAFGTKKPAAAESGGSDPATSEQSKELPQPVMMGHIPGTKEKPNRVLQSTKRREPKLELNLKTS